MNSVIKISGLDCANCARELEEEIAKIKGVSAVSVDFMAQKVVVEAEDGVLEKVKYVCDNFEDVRVVKTDAPEENGRGERIFGEKIKIANLCCWLGCFTVR